MSSRLKVLECRRICPCYGVNLQIRHVKHTFFNRFACDELKGGGESGDCVSHDAICSLLGPQLNHRCGYTIGRCYYSTTTWPFEKTADWKKRVAETSALRPGPPQQVIPAH